MKLLLKFLGITIFLIVVISSCKKTMIDAQHNEIGVFDANAVKKWYYTNIENNSSINQLDTANKRFPIWKSGVYHKTADFEVLEFPLIKNKNEIQLVSKLNEADKKRIAAASLSRIRFIKDKTGNITIIEVSYVPELNYLQKMNFDISNTFFGFNNNNFTGNMKLKKWNGKVINEFLLKDGKVKRKIKSKSSVNDEDTSNFNEVDCGECSTEMCVIAQTCIVVEGVPIYCGEWELIPGSCYCVADETCGSDNGGDEEEDDDCTLLGLCGDDEEEVDEFETITATFDNPIAHETANTNTVDWKIYDVWEVEVEKCINKPEKSKFVSATYVASYYTNLYEAYGGFNGWQYSINYCLSAPGNIGIHSTQLQDNNKRLKVSGDKNVIFPNQQNLVKHYENTLFKYANSF
jgi:hypothetical protein